MLSMRGWLLHFPAPCSSGSPNLPLLERSGFSLLFLSTAHKLIRHYGPSHLHFITFTYYRRLPLLLSIRARNAFVQVLGEMAGGVTNAIGLNELRRNCLV